MKLFVALLPVLLFTASSWGQVQVSGQVLDTEGSPLFGANIYIDGTYDGGASNLDGLFQFSTAAQDSAFLIIEYIGFESQKLPVHLQSDLENISVSLEEKFNEIDAVTITAGSFEAGDSKKAVALKPLDIVTTAGALGDIVGAMQTLPGTTTNGESGRLFVRGGSSEETQTYVDGLLVHEPYTRTSANTAVRGRFNPFIFSGTTFNTGAYSAEFGQALSSVLLLNTKDMDTSDEFNIGLMTIGADMAATKTWDSGSVTATAGYINLGPYLKLAPGNFDFSTNPNTLNASASLKQKTSTTGLFKVYTLHSVTRYGISTPSIDNLRTENINGGDDNTYINTSWKEVLGKKWVIRTGLAFSKNKERKTVNQATYGRDIHGLHAKLNMTYILSEKAKWKIGSDYFKKEVKNQFENGATTQISFHQDRQALYTELEIFLSSKIALKGGLRGELALDDNNRNATLVPRITGAIRTGERSQVSLAYGHFYQDAPDESLIMAQNTKQEKAEHLIANYQYTSNDKTFRAEVYAKSYTQLIKFTSDISTNKGSGFANGLDLWFRDNKTVKNGEYWISYSFINSQRDYRNYPHSATPSFVAKHNFSAVYKHWFDRLRTLASATYSYTAPRVYNDPNEETFQTAKMNGVHTVNLSISYLHRENIIFYTAVSNLIGTPQQYGYRFSTTPNQNGVYDKQAIIPMQNRFFFLGCFITLSKTGANQLDKLN